MMTPEERASTLHSALTHPPGELVVVHRDQLVMAIRAAENDARNAALQGFATFLLEHRPSAAQLKISPDYNDAVLAAFGWAANEARKRAATAKLRSDSE